MSEYADLIPQANSTPHHLLYIIAANTGGGVTGVPLASIGSPSDPVWNGTDPDATVISLLKAIAINTAAP